MPRKKGTGRKSKLSVSIDTEIVLKLEKRFKNDPGEKSRFVNRILSDNLDNYLEILSKTIGFEEKQGELEQKLEKDEKVLVVEAKREEVEGRRDNHG